MFEWRRRLYIGGFFRPVDDRRAQTDDPGLSTIEDSTGGGRISGIVAVPKRRVWHMTSIPEVLGMAAIEG
jgi:hypothetical protein